MKPTLMRRLGWTTFLAISVGGFLTTRYFCQLAVQAEENFDRTATYKTVPAQHKGESAADYLKRMKREQRAHSGSPLQPGAVPFGGTIPAPGAPGLAGAATSLTAPPASVEDATEQAALQFAKELREKATKAPGGAAPLDEGGRHRLTNLVEAAFDARHRLQAEEVQALRNRLELISQQLANREQLRKKIIERRVEELLNPSITWDKATPEAGGDAGPSRTAVLIPAPPRPELTVKNEDTILHAVMSKTTVGFVDTQLIDALKFLQEQHKITIYIDEKALQQASIPTDSPINLSLSDITLYSVLNLMLKPLKLGFIIEDEVLKITTQSRLQERKEPDVLAKLADRNNTIQVTHEKIAMALDQPTTVSFIDTQVADALKFLQEQHGIPIYIDKAAWDEESIATDTPVTLQIRNVSLRSILNLMLKPMKLEFKIEDEVLKIRPRPLTKAEQDELKRQQALEHDRMVAASTKGNSAVRSNREPELPTDNSSKSKEVRSAAGSNPTPAKAALERTLPSFVMRTPAEYRKAFEEVEKAIQESGRILEAFRKPGEKMSSQIQDRQRAENEKYLAASQKRDSLLQEFGMQLNLLKLWSQQADLAAKSAEQKRDILKRARHLGKETAAEILDAERAARQAQLQLEEAKAILTLFKQVFEAPGAEGVRRKLDSRCTVGFVDTALQDALKYLKEQGDFPNVVLDEKSLHAEQISVDSPVNLTLKDVKLSQALKLMLEPLKLTYVIEDDVLKITTLKQMAEKAAVAEKIKADPKEENNINRKDR